MNSIQNAIVALGGNVESRRVGLWATILVVATTEDAAKFGLVAGQKYQVWVAQTDGKTQSGKPVTKGDWFAVIAE